MGISNQDNAAKQDGGGISLAQGAILSVDTPTCGSACQSTMRANGLCDLACMTAGCNWDDGEVLIKHKKKKGSAYVRAKIFVLQLSSKFFRLFHSKSQVITQLATLFCAV